MGKGSVGGGGRSGAGEVRHGTQERAHGSSNKSRIASKCCFFFFSSRRRHTRWTGDWSSDVCSSDLAKTESAGALNARPQRHGEHGGRSIFPRVITKAAHETARDEAIQKRLDCFVPHRRSQRRVSYSSCLRGAKPSRLHSVRYITRASTKPRRGWRKALGSRPTMAKPQRSHNWMARSLVTTTKLNCMARKPRARAASSECTHMARAMPRPAASAAVM